MRDFDINDYEKLRPLEAHLRRGYYGKYYYGLRRQDFDKLAEVYRSLGFTQSVEYSCGRCILQLTCALGEHYFKYQAEQSKKPVKPQHTAKKETKETAKVEPIKEATTKAVGVRGRKKKN